MTPKAYLELGRVLDTLLNGFPSTGSAINIRIRI